MGNQFKGMKISVDTQKSRQLRHNRIVKENGEVLTKEINHRLSIHDKDKLKQLDIWARFQIVSRSGLKFGTKDYNDLIKFLDVENVLLKHRKNSPHHPEFFDGDFSKMSLIDLVELSADWYTANSTRASGTEFSEMLDYQQNIYGFSDELKSILNNTFDFLAKKNKK